MNFYVLNAYNTVLLFHFHSFSLQFRLDNNELVRTYFCINIYTFINLTSIEKKNKILLLSVL